MTPAGVKDEIGVMGFMCTPAFTPSPVSDSVHSIRRFAHTIRTPFAKVHARVCGKWQSTLGSEACFRAQVNVGDLLKLC